MKILQIANGYIQNELYGLLFHALGKLGINNEVFVPIKKGSFQDEMFIHHYKDEFRVKIVQCFSQIDRFLYFTKQNKMIKNICELYELEEIDIVHSHTLFSSGYTAMKLKEKFGKPYIVAVRNVDVNIFFKKLKWLKHTGISVMQQANKIIFLSPAYKEYVVSHFVPVQFREEILEKSETIPNGISEMFLRNKGTPKYLNGNKIRLIYAGEINKNKNLIETIRAAHMLKKRGVDVSIICVGNVTEKACASWVTDCIVVYYPKCSQEELLRYYRCADIFVMPSRMESFGLVYAEAMSQGLPVIYTRGQGFDQQFSEGEVGYAVSSDDFKELADRIIDICNNYEEISKNCLQCVDRFNWDAIALRYVDLYQDCV